MQTAVIIDDEFDARRILRKYLERYFPEIVIKGEAESVSEGVELIQNLKPEFAFLDIKMGDGTGFDLIDRLHGFIPKIIFTTAFDEFAVKAFRYHAIDYLLKPIDPEVLIEAMNKLIHEDDSMKKDAWQLILDQLSSNNSSANNDKKIGIPTLEGFKFIPIENIVFFEADSSYCILHIKDEKQMVISKPLRFFEDKLELEKSFIRPHKSFLVNLKFVEEYQKQDGGCLKMNNGKLIPISRNKKDEVLSRFEKYFM